MIGAHAHTLSTAAHFRNKGIGFHKIVLLHVCCPHIMKNCALASIK